MQHEWQCRRWQRMHSFSCEVCVAQMRASVVACPTVHRLCETASLLQVLGYGGRGPGECWRAGTQGGVRGWGFLSVQPAIFFQPCACRRLGYWYWLLIKSYLQPSRGMWGDRERTGIRVSDTHTHIHKSNVRRTHLSWGQWRHFHQVLGTEGKHSCC